MAYQTVRDIVEQVRSIHRRLQNAVREAGGRMDDDRAELLLAVIDEHEHTLTRAVDEVGERSRDRVLDTWLQFQPSEETERVMRERSSFPMSSEELAAYVLETENALIRLYQLLQGSTGSESVQSFFGGLAALEESAARRSARLSLEARDA